jgi:hypothetical protein
MIRKLAADVKELGLSQQQVQEYEHLEYITEKVSLLSTSIVQEIPYRRKRLVTKNHNTGSHSTIMEVSMQLGIRGQGSKTISRKAKDKGTTTECHNSGYHCRHSYKG